MKPHFLALLFLLLPFITARTAEEWKSRRIYQIITDRFARSDGDMTLCADLGNYCGGTWKGIEKNLDYIQGMGFNAIWISPIQENREGGYHGYWYSNFYKTNDKFGTEQDFKDLVKACHDRDIWVMVDVVPNHVGYVQSDIKNTQANDYSSVVPFDKEEYYHPFEMNCIDARKYHADNQTAVNVCWLAYLPDLKQEHPFVRKTLLEWISWMTDTYNIDGYRLDAAIHVPTDFWVEFQKAAKVFCVGEAFDERVSYNSIYQRAIGSMLNFPLNARLYWTMVKNESMVKFEEYYKEAYSTWPDITVLTNFMNNHDISRFLAQNPDLEAFKSAIVFVMTSIGIPSVYYGDEQAFKGGDDPQNREALWGHMDTQSDLYQFIRELNMFHQEMKLYTLDQVQREVDDTFYSFTRGEIFFAFTNTHEPTLREIENHPYEDGTWLCDFLNKEKCMKVEKGKFALMMENRQARILVPSQVNPVKNFNFNVLQSINIPWKEFIQEKFQIFHGLGMKSDYL